jgi:hypothetical protein
MFGLSNIILDQMKQSEMLLLEAYESLGIS